MSAAVDALAMQVDRDTVLQARKVILDEALRLRRAILATASVSNFGLCGADPVSEDARLAFGDRILAMAEGCRQHAGDLESAAATLADVGRRYGFTEDEIAASFGAR